MNDLPTPTDAAPPFSARGRRIGVFVIAYNAERHIGRTLSRIPPDVWRELETVYVLDDCSTDETVARALDFPNAEGKLVVLRNRTNRRYGGNQKLGYQYALDRGLDVVVMLHADGQYAPERLADLLTPLVEDRADVVFGSRMLRPADARRGGMPLYKFVGNIVLTRIENALSGMRLSEFHSGYRAYRVDFLRRIPFWENSDEWHFDTHILFQAHAAGARVLEVPIPTYYGDEICHVNGIAYGLNCILSAFGFWLHRRGLLYARTYDLARDASRYTSKFDDPWSSHSVIWHRLAREPLAGARVLELGVGDAALTRRLHAAGALVDGVDIDAEAARIAQPFCRTVRVADLSAADVFAGNRGFDLVVAADVLEHLPAPEVVLSQLKVVLRKGGMLVVSLPNIANLYVRLNLLFGRFPTHTKGLLDASHLHCYTLPTMVRLLTRTGWVIEERFVTSIPLPIVFPFMLRRPWRWGLALLAGLTRLLPGVFAYQGVFICRNPNAADLL